MKKPKSSTPASINEVPTDNNNSSPASNPTPSIIPSGHPIIGGLSISNDHQPIQSDRVPTPIRQNQLLPSSAPGEPCKIYNEELFTFNESNRKGRSDRSNFSDVVKKEKYIDNSIKISNIIKENELFNFLRRPRRFGKTLFLLFLLFYFLGHEDLFEQMAIYDEVKRRVRQKETYTVIFLDLSAVKDPADKYKFRKYKTEDEIDEHVYPAIEGRFFKLFNNIAAQYELPVLKEMSIASRFQELIEKMAAANSARGEGYERLVVILIDEYDSALLANIELPLLRDIFVKAIQSMVDIMKQPNCKRFINFCFIAGVTSFSLLEIASSFNVFKNWSNEPAAATLIGCTIDEVSKTFSKEIVEIARTMPELSRYHSSPRRVLIREFLKLMVAKCN